MKQLGGKLLLAVGALVTCVVGRAPAQFAPPRFGGIAPDPQISFALQAYNAGLHLQLRSSRDVQIQANFVEDWIRLRKAGGLDTAFQVSAKIESRSEAEFDNCDIAREQRTSRASVPLEVCVGRGTHTGRIP